MEHAVPRGVVAMRPELELRQLRVFVAVVDQGGVSKAARVLGISQSTASEALASLERTLGSAVLERGRRALKVTPAGDALLPHARRLLAAADAARDDVLATAASARDVIAVGANASIAAYVLPELLAGLRQHHPNVRYDISAAVCTDVREGVTSGRFALGLVVEPDRADDDERVSRLSPARLVVFANPDHPLAGRRATPAELWDQPFYLSDAAGSFVGVLRRHFGAAGFDARRLHSVGSVEGVQRSVAADPAALGVLPEHALGEALAGRRIAEVGVTPALPKIWLKALAPRVGEAPRAAVAALLEHLRHVKLAAPIRRASVER
jgi:DNA-binding transcriptional LysR family regulator